MAEQSTFIKIDRNIMRWRWWSNHNTLIVFLTLLLTANIQEHSFERDIIRRGEVATSISTISQQTKLSPQSVRTAINHLKSTGEITIRSTNRYQVITIVNYDLYQSKSTSKLTSNQQTANKQLTNKSTTIKEYIKNDKNGKNGKNNKGRSAPDSPSGIPERGTKAFKAKSHLLLKREEGTVDDIPDMYRDMFDDFARYYDWRNQ